MSFNFTKLQPKASILSNGLRVANNHLLIGDDVLEGHNGGSRVGVDVDPANQAIRLRIDDNGYKLQEVENSGRRYVTCATKLIKQGMELGDYVPVPGQKNVFVRATGTQE